MGVCFACSLLLATVAAIYPARVAARMAPMEAMRVD
jgi:ABC-type antimicrobial peptide transport system permease subunit